MVLQLSRPKLMDGPVVAVKVGQSAGSMIVLTPGIRNYSSVSQQDLDALGF